MTVRATNATGAGPESDGVAVVPFSAAQAPGSLSAVRHNNGNLQWIDVTWTAPDLGGGELVGYQVQGDGLISGPFAQTVTTTSFRDDQNYCSKTATYQVRAITSIPGTGTQVKGPAESVSADPVDCTPGLVFPSWPPWLEDAEADETRDQRADRRNRCVAEALWRARAVDSSVIDKPPR